MFQKTYTTETLPLIEKVNRGQYPQYYVTNTHRGFIGRETFNRAQKLMMNRGKNKQQQVAHLFTHRILCPLCQRHFRAVNASRKKYWICATACKSFEESHTFRLHESTIKETTLNMLSTLYIRQNEIVSTCLALMREIEYTQSGSDTKLFELDQSIAALNDKALTLQRLNTKGFISPDEFRIQSEALASQRQRRTAQVLRQRLPAGNCGA